MARRPFRRDRDGRLRVVLDHHEVDLLRTLADELRELLESGTDGDEGRDRLFPRAYLDPTEEQAEQEWQMLQGADLLRGRLDLLSSVIASTDQVETGSGRIRIMLDEEQEAAWLGALNDARLVLGNRLGMTEDSEGPHVSADHPLAGLALVYDWLTALQADLIDVLLVDVGDDGRDDGGGTG